MLGLFEAVGDRSLFTGLKSSTCYSGMIVTKQHCLSKIIIMDLGHDNVRERIFFQVAYVLYNFFLTHLKFN